MLNQNDFRNLLSTPAPNSSRGGGKGLGDDKVRFDMKQIAKWDRENNKKGGGKSSNSGGWNKKLNKGHQLPPGMGKDGDDQDNEDQRPKYRDRTRERQKDSNPDYNPGTFYMSSF